MITKDRSEPSLLYKWNLQKPKKLKCIKQPRISSLFKTGFVLLNQFGTLPNLSLESLNLGRII